MSIINKTLQTIELKDGRFLAHANYGDPIGIPLFFFHGSNDSRLEAALLHKTAQQMRIRVIAPDRPGYGLSDFQPNRSLLDWPTDIAQLADALSIARFGVVGHSAGGPHALAVASALPNRVTSATLISSIAPPGSSNKGMHPMFRLVNFFIERSTRLHRFVTQQSAEQILQAPDKFFAQWSKVSQADGRLFQTNPNVTKLITAEMREAVHQGIEGMMHEHPLYKRPWGFALSSIKLPIHIWHGLADPQVPPAASNYLVTHLLHAVPHFIADEGHFSIMVNHQENILKMALNLMQESSA